MGKKVNSILTDIPSSPMPAKVNSKPVRKL